MEDNADYIEHNDLHKFSDTWLKGQLDTSKMFNDTINEVAARKSLAEMREQFFILHDFDTDILPKLAHDTAALRNYLKHKQKVENLIFLILYISGTILLAIGFYLDNKEKLRHFFKKRFMIETQS